MAFQTKTWTDRNVEYPGRRRLVAVSGETGVYDITREEGTIAAEGDPFNKETMEDLENRIATGLNKHVIQNVTISVTSFVTNTDSYATYYPVCTDYVIEDMTSTCYATVTYSPETDDLACMTSKCQTMTGALRLYADSVPTQAITIASIVWEELS